MSCNLFSYKKFDYFYSAIAAGVRGGMFTLTDERLNIRVRNRLFTSIIRQEIGFFDSTQTGEHNLTSLLMQVNFIL